MNDCYAPKYLARVLFVLSIFGEILVLYKYFSEKYWELFSEIS